MKAAEIRIQPQRRFQLINFREIYEHRDILIFLVWRDIKVLYAQTVLGFSWAIIRPLLSMLIFTVVFGRLAKMPSDGVPYPIFAYAALLPWTYFSTSFVKSADSLVSMSSTWTKVYFPRLILPLVPVVAALVDFFIASCVLALMMIYYDVPVNQSVVFMPLLVALMILTASGIGMWLSALAVQFRDVRHANQFLSQLLMYAAPVVWPASLIMDRFPHYGEYIRIVYGFYPMAGVIEGFRSALLGTNPMPWDLILPGSLSAILIFVSGALYFRNKERIFADVA